MKRKGNSKYVKKQVHVKGYTKGVYKIKKGKGK